MTLDEQARRVSTVPELKGFLEILGLSPEGIGYAHDREQRRGTGEVLLERLPDGTWEAAAHERGNVLNPRRFTTEAEAVRTLAQERLESHRRTRVAKLSPDERAEIDRITAAQLEYFTQRAKGQRQGRRPWQR